MMPIWARTMAVSAGVRPEEVDPLWSKHVDLCDRENSDYGGARWKGLIEYHLKNPSLPTIPRDDPAARAMRKAEREAKNAEENEYLKTAVSLKDYLADLRVKPDFGEELTPLEKHIIAFREPYPNEHPGDWLHEATIGAPRVPRVGVKPRKV